MNAVAEEVTSAPGGMSWARFKSMAVDSGQWIWGTAQGSFNTKATISQIIVDAVIGMVPLLGDATAARDLIAISMGLIDEPKKRDDKWEWVLLVVMLLALVPVFGGIAKGAGRLIVGAARTSEATTKLAKNIVEVLNRLGHGNAEKWLLDFHFADAQAKVVDALNRYTGALIDGLTTIRNRMHLPESLIKRIDQLRNGMTWLKAEGAKRIPDAIKELDQKLREVQAYIRSGGETTSRVSRFEVAAGEKAHTYTDERRLIEDGPLPARSAKNGWKQNPASVDEPSSWAPYYKHEDGYPDLSRRAEDGQITAIAANSGRMINRPLAHGEKVVRVFGPEGTTLGKRVGETFADGRWWWLGEPPANATVWRKNGAVLDEWNRDGYMVVGQITGKQGPKAVVGTISEQAGRKLSGQYLEGGAIQAFVEMSPQASAKLRELGQKVISTGQPESWIDLATGMVFEIKPTGWKDVNGVHGYLHLPGPGTVQTMKLGAREQASKTEENVQ
ncbi:hypothetical protein [Paraburkholderia tropica]|uniref:hypothetical protein n=1 Tax=Paraburkholderia tropica TaxID=92647 RepID=UPI002AB7AFC9|nr:hypothetical protein [Paraburkholderia tropica]